MSSSNLRSIALRAAAPAATFISVLAFILSAFAPTATFAAPTAAAVVYDAIPSTLPGNVASEGFQATQTAEFGDYIHLGGTNRILNTVTVTMSDWALASSPSNVTWCTNNPSDCTSSGFTYPITLNIYSNHLGANGVPDTLLATETQNINVPWRPEADPTDCSASPSEFQAADGNCYNGLAFNASFDMSGLNVALPNDVIVGVAYNTESWGASPTGVDGPYDSLNVGVNANQAVSVGTDDNTDDVFQNSETAANYTDHGATGVGIFRQDTGWSPYGTLNLEITATPPDATQSEYVESPSYVRADNSGDIAAIALVPAYAEQTQFTFTQTDGTNVYTDVPGAEHIQAGQFPIPSTGQHQYRVGVSADAGTYTVTGEYLVEGVWYPITGTGTTYVLSGPTASFVYPNASYDTFRPGDDPVRVSVDDTNDSFSDVVFSINGTNYQVNRADCDLREAGTRVLCDVSSASNWSGLTDGTYTATATIYDQARNNIQITSQSFTVSSAVPVVSNFQVAPQTLASTTLSVSTDATDITGIQNVDFYITAPRAADGICDGNGTSVADDTITTATGSTYSGSLDTSALNGEYCVNVVAENLASTHSASQSIEVNFDNAAPSVPVLTGPADGTTLTTNNFTFTWDVSTDNSAGPVTYEFQTSQDPSVDANGVLDGTGIWTPGTDLTTSSIPSSGAPDGTWYWQVRAVDAAGNKSAWSPIDSVTLNTVPPTPPVTPAVTTNTATGITVGDATLSGVSNTDASNESFWVSLAPIDASNSSNLPTGVESTSLLPAATAGTTFSAQLASLATSGVPGNLPAITPNTTYYYVAWADINGTWVAGAQQTVVTGQIGGLHQHHPGVAPTATFVFPTPGPSATSFQVVFNEPVESSDATNPANYFLTNYPGAGGSGPLTGEATVTYDAPTKTATVTLTATGWYLSPEQEWGVQDIHNFAGIDLSPDPTTAYTTVLNAPTAPGAPTTTTPTTSTSQDWTWTAATAVDPADDGSASDIASYSYEVTDDLNSNSVVTAWTNIGNVTAVTTNLPAGSYTIHVEATDVAGNVGPEADGSVVVNASSGTPIVTVPPAPVGISPTDGATTTTAALTQVSWTPVTDTVGGITYVYQSSNASTTNLDGSFTTPVYTSTAQSATSIPTPGTPDGTYYWHVQATDSASVTSPWSTTESFIIDNSGVPPAGPAPVADDQSVSLAENSSSTPITLTSSSGGTVIYSIVTPPANGTLSAVNGAVVDYTPNTGYTGGDSFTFEASNGSTSNVATVSIIVTPIAITYTAPVATDVTATSTNDAAVPITLAATDTDGDPLTYATSSSPTNGTLSAITGNTVTYTPNSSFSGTDSFTFTASDEGNATSSAATVTVNVTAAPPIVFTPQFTGGGTSGQFGGGSSSHGSTGGNSGGGSSAPALGQVLGASTYNFANNLTVGSRGEDVTQLQTILIADGYLKIASPTGYFGAMTKDAVKKYQAANNISPVSGYVGPLTRAVLNTGV